MTLYKMSQNVDKTKYEIVCTLNANALGHHYMKFPSAHIRKNCVGSLLHYYPGAYKWKKCIGNVMVIMPQIHICCIQL
jgi:hypothetical protein